MQVGQRGHFANAKQLILRSTNGGITFNSSFVGELGILYGSSLSSKNVGYVVGTTTTPTFTSSSNNQTNLIYKTINAGESWTGSYK